MMNHTAFTGFDSREARLAFLMPPPEGGPRPAEAERINKEAVDPAFNVENADATTDREVGRATQEQLQAKTKLVESAMKSFVVGLREFKDSYARLIKEATDSGDTDRAAKLTAERDQRTEKIVADVNARLAELASTRGFPSYQITMRAGEPVLGPGPTGRVDVRQALRNVPEELRKRVMNMPPAEQEVFARVLAGKTQPEIEALAPSLANALKQVQAMNPITVSAVIDGLDNPGKTPEQLAKQFRLTAPQAQQVRAFFDGLDAGAREVLRNHLAACRDVIRSGGGNGGTEIPANSPARNAIIEAAIGEPPLTPRQVGLFRVALAEYLEAISGPNATEADKQLEESKLVIKGVNLKASNLDVTKPPLKIRTIKQSEMESAMLAGALMYLMAFIDQIGGKSKPLTRPNTAPTTNAERQERLKTIERDIKNREDRLKVIDAQLNGTPRPDEKTTKDLTAEKTRIEGELKTLRAEREKLLKDIAGTPENPNAKRLAEIDKTLKANDEQIKKLTAERAGPPVPNADRVKAIGEEIAKLEKQNGELRAEKEKLLKEGGGPVPPAPPGPGEGPRLPLSEESRKSLTENADKAQKALDEAKLRPSSAERDAAVVQGYDSLIQAKQNQLAHYLEYSVSVAATPGEPALAAEIRAAISTLNTEIRQLRFERIDTGLYQKNNNAITRAEALPNRPGDENRNERKTRCDAIIEACRVQLAFLQENYPAWPTGIADVTTKMTTAIRERAAIEPVTPMEEAQRKTLDENREKAEGALASARVSADDAGKGERVATAYDGAIAATQAQLEHLVQYSVTPAPVAGEPALSGEIRAKIAVLGPRLAALRREKVVATTVTLRATSDRVERMPQTNDAEKLARAEAMIAANQAELNHLNDQDIEVARRTALEAALREQRQVRARLRPA